MKTSIPALLRMRLPFVILAFLLLLLFLNVVITGKAPEIDSIEPKIGLPGEVLLIKGSHFGRERGRVGISGIFPVSSAYLEWSPERISVRIPEDAGSGLVYVMTSMGRSDGVLFTNKNDIPVVLRGGAAPGTPYIESVEPERAPVGGLLVISGRNFGPNRETGLVFFPWAPAADAPGQPSDGGGSSIAASQTDFDYEAWSDGEIRVRIPVGAGSGGVFIRNDKGDSNSVFFELDQSAGRRIFSDKRTYTVQSSLDVRNTSEKEGGGLYLWIPRVQEGPNQREVQLLNQEPKAEIENHNGLTLVYLKDLPRGASRRVAQTFILDRYAVECRIQTDRLRQDYDTERPLYKAYTVSNSFTPASHPEIEAAARAAVGREKNPYRKARLIYSYLLRRMSYDPAKGYRDAVTGLKEKSGDSYTYATLFVALLRSAGIPARTIAGYVITDGKSAKPHFWTEFYLENFGWVPSDPSLGDKAPIKDLPVPSDPETYYFGSMSNRHIVFSRGLVQAKRISPQGRTLEPPEMHSLQTVYAEGVGDFSSFSGSWNDLQVVGVY